MLQIVPMTDREREDALLREIATKTAMEEMDAGADARVLVMTDGKTEMGFAAVGLLEKTLCIYAFSVNGKTDFSDAKPDLDTSFILDTLLRSAASYGETNGADKIVTAFPDFFDFMKQRGFTPCEAHTETPMSTIVRYE